MKHNYFLFCLVFFITTFLAIGQSNKYLQLDGVDDFMEVLHHEDLDIDSNENFTVTAWVKTTNLGEYFRIIDKRDGPASGPGYELFTNPSTGAFAINVATTTTNHGSPEYSNTSITDGEWHHIAFVVNRADGTNKVYANGVFQHQRTGVPASASFANAANLFLGKEGTNNQWHFNGAVDEFRIWSKAMTSEELSADMNTVIDGPEENLLAGWNFEDVTVTTVPDISGNDHSGTLNGGATVINPSESMVIQDVILTSQTTLPVGRGNLNERVVLVNIKTSGQSNPLTASALNLNLAGTEIPNITKIKVYYTGANRDLVTTNLFGEATPSTGTIKINGSRELNIGDNYFWVTYDISNNAEEGDFIDAAVESVTIHDEVQTLATSNITGSRLILLEHNTLWSGGDYGSVNYRIPAITTAIDGSLIVAADARIDRAGDLPNNIDIVVKRSTDNGKTWSEPKTIADFGTSGASDPALVVDRFTGDVICVFASHNGLFASTPNNKIRMYVSRSKDNGITWTEPVNISNQVYPEGWYAAWVASGSMHQTRSGRIIAVAGTRKDGSTTLTNNMIYSEDGGYTWGIETNSPMPNGGDETKIIELNDGTYLMNHRDQYKSGNYRRISTSTDQGVTWTASVQETQLVDPGVNADLIRYTSVKDGFDENRILFSNPKHPDSRENLHVYLSKDETATWPTSNSKQIFEGPSAYSSLTILEDGTIGLIYENGEFEDYQITFARFSLDWLSSGTDSYSKTQLPESASNLTAESKEGGIQLTWEDNSTIESGFRIYRSETSGSGYTILNGVGPNNTTYLDESTEINKTYYYVVKAFNPEGEAGATNEVSGAPLNNCELSSMAASEAVYIQYVKFANTTPAFEFASVNNGYEDNTAQVINMTPGEAYTLHIGAGDSEVVAAKRLDIWIDYNQDGDFEDEGELFLGWGSDSYTGTDLKFTNKTVSADAFPGETRMRVALKATNSPSSPCDTFTDGEVEDYTINFEDISEPFCAPTAMAASEAVYIQYVKFANTTPAFEFASVNNGYEDNSAQVINMTPGEAYTLHIGAGDSEVVAAKRLDIWIDYNQDGDFEDEDELFLGWGSDSYTGTDLKFTNKMISADALPGETRMRVALKATNSPSSPCDTFSDGEVEDYTVNFEDLSEPYCAPVSMTASEAVFIQYVKFANSAPAFDFASDNNGYEDNTAQVINMAPGEPYTLHIGAGDSEVVAAKRLDIWIDYNQDGDFEDDGELFLGWGSDSYTGTDLKFTNKTISADAFPGETRMRVALKATNSPSSPCDTFTNGEVEDYTILFSDTFDECSEDNTAPIPTEESLPDVVSQCEVGVLTPPTAIDDCSDTVAVSHDANLPITTPGITQVTWTFEDSNGNISTQSQNVIIADTESPELISNIELSITAQCNEIPAVPELNFTDNCDDDVQVNYTEEETSQGDTYKITRRWIATDKQDNTREITQEINVQPTVITNPTANDKGITKICIILSEVDLFDLIDGETGNGFWEVEKSGLALNGSILDPSESSLGQYVLTYTESENCNNKIEIIIEIFNDCGGIPKDKVRITVSDVLTPNGDGINDFFVIEGPDVKGKSISLIVFNRWGQPVYKSNNYQNNWDAGVASGSIGFNGKLSSGTYYYVIEIPNSTINPIKGNIYIGTN